MPATFLDEPNAGQPVGSQQVAADEASLLTLARVRRVALPALVREAEDRGWWRPSLTWAGHEVHAGTPVSPSDAAGVPGRDTEPHVRALDAEALGGLRRAVRTISPFDARDALALLRAAVADGARVVGAIAGDTLVGVGVASGERLLALGVAPSSRRRGLGAALLRSLVEGRPPGSIIRASVNSAERDVVEPLDVGERMEIATRLLRDAGFELERVSPDVRRDDPWAIEAVLTVPR
jgi:ribosomal protein S18 acetylase RimI-like enzyme